MDGFFYGKKWKKYKKAGALISLKPKKKPKKRRKLTSEERLIKSVIKTRRKRLVKRLSEESEAMERKKQRQRWDEFSIYR